jgi:hypothetical protein
MLVFGDGDGPGVRRRIRICKIDERSFIYGSNNKKRSVSSKTTERNGLDGVARRHKSRVH